MLPEDDTRFSRWELSLPSCTSVLFISPLVCISCIYRIFFRTLSFAFYPVSFLCSVHCSSHRYFCMFCLFCTFCSAACLCIVYCIIFCVQTVCMCTVLLCNLSHAVCCLCIVLYFVCKQCTSLCNLSLAVCCLCIVLHFVCKQCTSLCRNSVLLCATYPTLCAVCGFHFRNPATCSPPSSATVLPSSCGSSISNLVGRLVAYK